MKKTILCLVLVVCLLCLTACAGGRDGLPKSGQELPWQDQLISEFYTDKAAYSPGDPVQFTLELDNQTGSAFRGRVELFASHLLDREDLPALDVSLNAGEKTSLSFAWTPPAEDFRGYLVTARVTSGGVVKEQRNTAVDVSSDWSRYPRYGYLCEFGDLGEGVLESTVERLNRYHINGCQFYDWQDEHDKPLAGTVESPAAEWADIAHRPIRFDTVTGYIDALHQRNMMAANYNLMFGAYEDYESKGAKAEWGLYRDEHHREQDSHPLTGWESSLYLMDLSNPEWQDYILAREKDVFDVFDFDVFHIDTLGYRGYVYDYDGNDVDMAADYGGFLTAAKEKLGKRLLVNTVNGYGALAAAQSDVDFLYEEVWPSSFSSYRNLKQVVDAAFDLSQNRKGSVIAAYVNYESAGKEFNPNAVKLADATLFACGAGHLELGDTGMLSHEYFPNAKMILSPDLERDLRDYYDFLVAYEEVLRAQDTREEFYGELEGAECSAFGERGSVWVFGTDSEAWSAWHLINLVSRGENGWRDDFANCEDPELQKDLTLHIPWEGAAPQSAAVCSPDVFGGSPMPASFTLKDGVLTVKVPYLEYWDMVLLQK